MSPSPVLKFSVMAMLALSLSACSLSGSTEPTSGPTARPTETPAMTSTPIAMEAKIDGETIASATPAASATPKEMKVFTMAEIATHDSGDSCYVAFQGGVYDITAFIPKHPEGPKPLSKCGQAIDDFSAIHPGGKFDTPQMQQFLATMKVGTVK